MENNQINKQELDLETQMWIETSERAIKYAGVIGFCKGTLDLIMLNLEAKDYDNAKKLVQEALNEITHKTN